jgi:hypothetical protein
MREHVRHEAVTHSARSYSASNSPIVMDRYADFGHWGKLFGLRRDPLTSDVRASDDVLADFRALEYALYPMRWIARSSLVSA